jgi:hypothetical protein
VQLGRTPAWPAAAGDNHPIPAAEDPMLAGEAEAGAIRVAVVEEQADPIAAADPSPAAASAEACSSGEAGNQS